MADAEGAALRPFVTVNRIGSIGPAPARPRVHQRSPRRLSHAIAPLALTALAGIPACTPRATDQAAVRRLAQWTAEHAQLVPRLALADRPSRCANSVRSDAPQSACAPFGGEKPAWLVDLHISAERSRRIARTPWNPWALGLLALTEPGERRSLDIAWRRLAEARALSPGSAGLNNDMGAVELQLALERDEPWRLAGILEQFDSALAIDSALEAARANRELVLSLLGLARAERRAGNSASSDLEIVRREAEDSLGTWGASHLAGDTTGATRAWNRFRELALLLRERTGDLLLEAHLSRLTSLQATSKVALRRVAAGHARFAQLREGAPYADLTRRSELKRAEEELRGTPFRAWASLDLTIGSFFDRDLEKASEKLEKLIEVATHRKYLALQARARWILGLVRQRQGRFSSAHDLFASARAAFEDRLQEPGNGLYLRSMAAKSLKLAGSPRQAWRERIPVLRGIAAIHHPERRATVLEEAVEAAIADDRSALALLYLDRQLEVAAEARAASHSHDADNEIFALLARARLHRSLGRKRDPDRDLARAEELWRRQAPEDETRERQGRLLAVERALLKGTDEVEVTTERALAASSGDQAQDRLDLLQLHLDRAEFRRARGDNSGALADLGSAIAEIEHERSELYEPELRSRYLARSQAVYERRAALELSVLGDSGAALATMERAANRLLLEAIGRRPTRVEPKVPTGREPALAGRIVLRYILLPDRLLLWTFTGGRLDFEQRPIDRRHLIAETARCRTEVLAGKDLSAAMEGCATITSYLRPKRCSAWPAESPALVVADAALAGLPWAVLPMEAPSEPWVRRRPLLGSTSLTLLAQTEPPAVPRRRKNAKPPSRVPLFVLDPSFDKGLGLMRLREAPHLREGYRRLYPGAKLIEAEMATQTAVLARLSQHRAFQFDGHGVPDPEDPSHRALLLAKGPGGQGYLRARDLTGLDLSNVDLAVLGGCSTTFTTSSETSDPSGLAAAFLASGARRVLTTAWDIPAAPAAALFLRFHEGVASGQSPERALQAAQLGLLSSANSDYTRPASWAGYQLQVGGWEKW